MVEGKRPRLHHQVRRRRLRTELSPRWRAIIADMQRRQRGPFPFLLLPKKEIALAKSLLGLGERPDFMVTDVVEVIAGGQVTPLVFALLLAKDREEFEKRVHAERLKRARDSASRPRKAKKYDATTLLALKAEYIKKRGMEYGWISHTARKSGLCRRTILRRIKEKVGQ